MVVMAFLLDTRRLLHHAAGSGVTADPAHLCSGRQVLVQVSFWDSQGGGDQRYDRLGRYSGLCFPPVDGVAPAADLRCKVGLAHFKLAAAPS